MDKQLDAVIAIADKLQEWIEGHDLSNAPVANVTWTAIGTTSMSIDGAEVWCSEVDGEEYLTFDWCKMAFLRRVATYRPFMDEALAIPADMPF